MKESADSEKKAGTAPARRNADISSPVADERGTTEGPLVQMVQRARCMGCNPSLESVARVISGRPVAQRRAAAMSLQRTKGNRFVQRMALQAKSESNRTGMPDHLKAGIERLSGLDMSDVRVHANSDKPAQLNALAYTQGNQIHLGPGQERHLPHEAWHVVQQKQGRVSPTVQITGVAVNDDMGLEKEANERGNSILQTPCTTETHPIQCANVVQFGGESIIMGAGGEPRFHGTEKVKHPKFMGYFIIDKRMTPIWWDRETGKYVNFKGTEVKGIVSERYFAEGTGYHAFNIARDYTQKEQKTLVKGTEFQSRRSMTSDWGKDVESLEGFLRRNEREAPNLKLSFGGSTGDVRQWDKRRDPTRPWRKHDLMQFTFPRGDMPIEGREEDAKNQDANLIADFLQYAQPRLKEGGEARVVLINGSFYNQVMGRAIEIAQRRARQLGYSISLKTRREIGIYHEDPKFQHPMLSYTHRMTGSKTPPPSEAEHGDIIYIFTFSPLAAAPSGAPAATSMPETQAPAAPLASKH